MYLFRLDTHRQAEHGLEEAAYLQSLHLISYTKSSCLDDDHFIMEEESSSKPLEGESSSTLRT